MTPVVFALANPDPEVDPAEAEKYAAVVASGRSDYPNQINNVLAFPGVFRGLLDARASEITIEMLLRAAEAIALVVKDDELNPNFIIPTVFHADVPKAVAAAISGKTGGVDRSRTRGPRTLADAPIRGGDNAYGGSDGTPPTTCRGTARADGGGAAAGEPGVVPAVRRPERRALVAGRSRSRGPDLVPHATGWPHRSVLRST